MSTDAATESLLPILRQNAVLWEALQRIACLDLPDVHLGAGCVAQTVWNHLYGNDPNCGIRDYDVAYFDEDLSATAESAVSARVCTELADLNVKLDVKNQARVHLWYAQRFGYEIVPYTSIADAISTWPTTATAVGIHLGPAGPSACAPHGIRDLLNGVVRPNRVQITRDIYRARVDRLSRHWPSLEFLEWEDGVGEEASRWVHHPGQL